MLDFFVYQLEALCLSACRVKHAILLEKEVRTLPIKQTEPLNLRRSSRNGRGHSIVPDRILSGDESGIKVSKKKEEKKFD